MIQVLNFQFLEIHYTQTINITNVYTFFYEEPFMIIESWVSGT